MDWLGLYAMLAVMVLSIFLLGTMASLATLPCLRRPQRDMDSPASAPFVSILVPARNEEGKIGECLRNLRAQEGIEGEIVLLDDHSEDGTRAIAAEIAAQRTGLPLQIRSGQPLPSGWGGKPWACQQLGKVAVGEILLFVDADTTFAPGAVRAALDLAATENCSLLSVWPQQITQTWPEKLIVPLIYLLSFGFLPLWLQRWVKTNPRVGAALSPEQRARLGAANGQFMLFTRAGYETVGGHEAVRDHMVEDVALARIILRRRDEGLTLVNAGSTGLVRCRMYENFGGVIEGLSKNLRPLFEADFAACIFTVVSLVVFGAVPFFLLPFALSDPGRLWSVLLFVAMGIALAQRILIGVRHQLSWLSTLLHPIALLAGLGIGSLSWWRSRTGNLVWKGRKYSPQGGAKGEVDS